jgi:mRNA-degrading endonuclease toxin of MazEF toxin-antitoxin module
MAEQVRALAKSRLIRRRGALPDQIMARIDRALSIALDLPLPITDE